jgi:hypothetical protein
MSEPRSLVQDLNDLHASYVTAVNEAIADDDTARADRLAAEYDAEAIQLIAEREGKTHLLPINRPTEPDTPLRRLVRRLTAVRAA